MRSWSILSTLAVTGALLTASPAYPHGSSGNVWSSYEYERLSRSSEEVLAAPDLREVSSAPTVTEGASIEGQVAAIDRESGRFVLDTESGPVSFVTWPAELIALEVGDVVRVSFLQGSGS